MKTLATAILVLACGNLASAKSAYDAQDTVYLSQGWDENARQIFYYAPQGSALMPYDWAKSMENPNDTTLFLTSENIAKFGYIPQGKSQINPDGLPIGFTRDDVDGRAQLGVNCAACHTSEVRFNGRTIRIDGGPSLSNFQKFVSSMDGAIEATAADKEKFKRFADRLLGNNARNEQAVSRLRGEFAGLVKLRREWQQRNGTSMEYGAGRNDAFGIIFNQVLAADLGIPENRREPNAPVSYPVMWDAHQHDIVQWIGIARNNLDPAGPLSRNIGQVLGVFGHVDFSKKTKVFKGYCSSARRNSLETLENQLKTLWSPQWPETTLGEIEKEKASAGKLVYAATCAKCHAEIDRRDPNRIIRANMIGINTVKTDPSVAANAASRTALTGRLQGSKLMVLQGRKLEAKEPATLVLRHAVAGSMIGTFARWTCHPDTAQSTRIKSIFKVVKTGATNMVKNLFTDNELDHWEPFEQRMTKNEQVFMKYKARPLNGVWASAPYLHNGSVKNLYEMLLPADQRSTKFVVGCSDFDPTNVGFECAEGTAGTTVLDTSIPGNSNSGHEFAAGLSKTDRLNLLEYLKTL